MEEKKLSILKDLLVDEEHTLEELQELVGKAKPFLKIEAKTGEIILTPEYNFTIAEKILVFMIGIYFAKELELNENDITSRYISENIEIPQTSLSGSLGSFVRLRILSYNDGVYAIKFYEIGKQLEILTKKYILKQAHSTIITKQPSPKKINKTLPKNKNKTKTKLKTNSSKNATILDKDIEIESLELEKYDLNEELLENIYHKDNSSFVILKGFKGINNIESHLKGTLLVLTGIKLFYNIDEISSSELMKFLTDSGVHLKNISTNLKKYSTLIIHKRGAIGNTNTTYKLTHLGFREGIILIKDILNNTSNFAHKFTNSYSGKGRSKAEPKTTIEIEPEKLLKNISEFSKRNDIEENTLRSVFDFQPNGVRLTEGINEKSRNLAQIKGLLFIGLLIKKIYQTESFDAKSSLKSSHINYDRLDLLDKNKFYKKYFAKKPKTVSQLTFAGEIKATEMLKTYLETRNCEL